MAQSAWAATLLLGALIDSTTSAAAGKLSLVTWNLMYVLLLSLFMAYRCFPSSYVSVLGRADG